MRVMRSDVVLTVALALSAGCGTHRSDDSDANAAFGPEASAPENLDRISSGRGTPGRGGRSSAVE